MAAQAAGIGPHIHSGHDLPSVAEGQMGHMGLLGDAIHTPLLLVILLSQAHCVPGRHLRHAGHPVTPLLASQAVRGDPKCFELHKIDGPPR